MSTAQFTTPQIVQSAGNVIVASEWNAEFTNLYANLNPAGIGGLQDSLAQKQLQEDPATGLVASLQKEIEQIRFVLKRITGTTYWYDAPSSDLADSFLKEAQAADATLGDGTKTTTDPLLTLNADTGDAGIRLQVNDTSANAWDIYNDNSDSDSLKLDYNGSTKLSLGATNGDLTLTSTSTEPELIINNTSTGDASIKLRVNDDTANEWKIFNDNSNDDALTVSYGGANKFAFDDGGSDVISFVASNISTATAPATNGLYPHSMIKAWASFDLDGTTSPTIQDSFNVSSIVASSSVVTVTFRTNMANDDYSVTFGSCGAAIKGVDLCVMPVLASKTTSTFTFYVASLTSTPAFSFVDPSTSTSFGEGMSFQVVGRQ
jgi:hypothetical protein